MLAVDVGGSHVKAKRSAAASDGASTRAGSEPPRRWWMVRRELTSDWDYDVDLDRNPRRPCAEGDGPIASSSNLGPGWAGFDSSRPLAKPTKVVNDATMQAIGGY